MRICLVNNLYKPFQKGGAERVVELMEQALREAGYDTHIITTRPRGGSPQPAPEVSYLPSLYHHLARLPAAIRLIYHIWDMFEPFLPLRISRTIRRQEADVVITHNLKGMGLLLPRLLCRQGVRHIHYLHDIQLLHPSGLVFYGQEKRLDSPLARLYQILNRKLFAHINALIAPSSWVVEMHKKRVIKKDTDAHILPSPLMPDTPEDQRQQRKSADTPTVRLLYVGQIEYHKGVHILLQAITALQKRRGSKRLKLRLLGEGSDYAGMKDQYKHNPDIIFTGKLDFKQAQKIMQQSDCLVLPSLCYENSPNVIYEAYANSLPVIASRLGGITELVRQHGGILFTPGDSHDLARKLEHCSRNLEHYQEQAKKIRAKLAHRSLSDYSARLSRIILD